MENDDDDSILFFTHTHMVHRLLCRRRILGVIVCVCIRCCVCVLLGIASQDSCLFEFYFMSLLFNLFFSLSLFVNEYESLESDSLSLCTRSTCVCVCVNDSFIGWWLTLKIYTSHGGNVNVHQGKHQFPLVWFGPKFFSLLSLHTRVRMVKRKNIKWI